MIGTMVFVVLGVLAAIGFFVYIGMKSPAQAVSANRKYLILTQSGHGVRPHRHHLHVDHVGLHLHAPDEPNHTAPPRSQEGVIRIIIIETHRCHQDYPISCNIIIIPHTASISCNINTMHIGSNTTLLHWNTFASSNQSECPTQTRPILNYNYIWTHSIIPQDSSEHAGLRLVLRVTISHLLFHGLL